MVIWSSGHLVIWSFGHLRGGFLILDEPTEGIQPNDVHQIGDAILALNQPSTKGNTDTTSSVVDEIVEAIVKVNQDWGVTVLLVDAHLRV